MKSPERGMALGKPGAVVQQLAGGHERSGVDGSGIRQTGNEVTVQLPVRVVAEERQSVRSREAVPGVRGVEIRELEGRRKRIVDIEATRHLGHSSGVRYHVRKHGHAVQGSTRRHDTAGGPPTFGGFEAHEAVERRRHPARPRRVGAECEGREAELHGHRRPAAAATGDVIRVQGVGRCAVG